MNEKKLSPSEYLRARHPERYSDSTKSEGIDLSRDILEYRLETITSRSEEKAFEYFCRRLAEKTICPNLIYQTGPTGGGDSKVDSETTPVANDIAIRWYQGNTSASEKWAFAISSKEDWVSKIRSDVKSITGTNRGYSLIYFFTSRYVSDRKRAEREDALSKEFGIPVKIRDRNWIVEQVIDNDHTELAIQTLSIDGLSSNPTKIIGPRDSIRTAELEKLDAEINDTDRYAGASYQLAEDCLRAAILASCLEKDRHEIDGRFAAALRVAEEVNDSRQILRVLYKQSWVSYFTFDDIRPLLSLYKKIESIALNSEEVEDVDKLKNLFNILVAHARHNEVNFDEMKLKIRSDEISKNYESL